VTDLGLQIEHNPTCADANYSCRTQKRDNRSRIRFHQYYCSATKGRSGSNGEASTEATFTEILQVRWRGIPCFWSRCAHHSDSKRLLRTALRPAKTKSDASTILQRLSRPQDDIVAPKMEDHELVADCESIAEQNMGCRVRSFHDTRPPTRGPLPTRSPGLPVPAPRSQAAE